MKKFYYIFSLLAAAVIITGCGMSKAQKDLADLYNSGTASLNSATKVLQETQKSTDAAKAIEDGFVTLKDVAEKEEKIIKENTVTESASLKAAQDAYVQAGKDFTAEIKGITKKFPGDAAILNALRKVSE